MADVEDVMDALVAKCAATVYPKGNDFPSVGGVDIAVYPGWPVSGALDVALKAGKVHVSIFPLDMERNTTRFQRVWQPVSIAAPTITLTASDDVITVGGAMPSPFSPHNLVALIQGKSYLYAVQSTDTLTSIVTALAALISVDFPLTTVAGLTITVGGVTVVGRDGSPIGTADGSILAAGAYSTPITCRVGTIGTSAREISRQKRLFQITVWAPSPETRKPIASAIDAALKNTDFLTMPDGSAARVEYFDSPMTDGLSKSRTYRRDLRYFVEYATTETMEAATIVVGRVTTAGGAASESQTDY